MVRKKVIVEIRVPKVPEHRLAATISEISSLLEMPGFELDKDSKPIPISPPYYLLENMKAFNETVILLGGEIEEGKEKELESKPNVIKVWKNARIQHHEYDCEDNVSKGDLNSVAKYLGVDKIWKDGVRGKGIVIGICDDGVNALSSDIVIDGWSPENCTHWGTAGGHGNMTATDAVGMCPGAKIYDIGVFKNPPGSPLTDEGLILNAIRGFQWAIEHHKKDGTPQILSNSWGFYQESGDPEYARNPDHVFTRKVVEAIQEGIVVCFSAGNCGGLCKPPYIKCGSDIGPGHSIWGANGHPEVITVGAANIRGEWVGYSSQGPAALCSEKPDFCGITHFKGYKDPDDGTSAAAPIIAGVIGLLKCAKPDLTQAQAKAVLRKTAKDIGEPGFDHNSGYGIIQAYAAYKLLKPKKKKKTK